MSLKYIQEHQPAYAKPKFPPTELSVKHGELYRGENSTGIVLSPDHMVRNALLVGAVVIAGAFVINRFMVKPSLSATPIKGRVKQAKAAVKKVVRSKAVRTAKKAISRSRTK